MNAEVKFESIDTSHLHEKKVRRTNMRNDFQYVRTVPVSVANKNASRKSMKTMLTGAMAAAFACGVWQAAIAVFGILAITNLVQKKKPVGED